MARKQKKVVRKSKRAARLGDQLRQRADAAMARATALQAKADRLEQVGSQEGLDLLEAHDKAKQRIARIETRLTELGIGLDA